MPVLLARVVGEYSGLAGQAAEEPCGVTHRLRSNISATTSTRPMVSIGQNFTAAVHPLVSTESGPRPSRRIHISGQAASQQISITQHAILKPPRISLPSFQFLRLFMGGVTCRGNKEVRMKASNPEFRMPDEPFGYYVFAFLPKKTRSGKWRWLCWLEQHSPGDYTLGNRAH